jgi:hypothetical protein
MRRAALGSLELFSQILVYLEESRVNLISNKYIYNGRSTSIQIQVSVKSAQCTNVLLDLYFPPHLIAGGTNQPAK